MRRWNVPLGVSLNRYLYRYTFEQQAARIGRRTATEKEALTMTTALLGRETRIETPEEAKARRNAEYLARIDKAIKDLDEGKGVTVTIEELEAMTNG
jgi:hypothetical protein